MKKFAKKWLYPIEICSIFLLLTFSCKKTDSSGTTPPANNPYAMFQYSYESNGVVRFYNTSHDATSYLWDFGDNTTSSSQDGTVDHAYPKNAPYKVTLTAYGNGKSDGAYAYLKIISANGGTTTDVEGNVYHIIRIGEQVWMVENLKTTHYNDGIPIPLVSDPASWSNLTTPAYCWFTNDSSIYKNPYGAIYNWYCAYTGRLAPQNWHIPARYEWDTLFSIAGGELIAGSRLKEAGTAHWLGNSDATNETGFTALGGGERYYDGRFIWLGIASSMWSSDSIYDGWVKECYLNNSNGYAQILRTETVEGCYVRCMMNDEPSH